MFPGVAVPEIVQNGGSEPDGHEADEQGPVQNQGRRRVKRVLLQLAQLMKCVKYACISVHI